VGMINRRQFEFFTPRKERGVIRSYAYPLHKVKEKFDILYLKSTIAYMLAYAATFEKPTEVHLYGIYQSDHLAYLFERPAVEFWLGVLMGQGVKVVSHDWDTRLFGGRPVFGGKALYGYECSEKKALRISEKEYKKYGSNLSNFVD